MIPKELKPRIEKLPVWAKDLIHHLQSEVEHLEKEKTAIDAGDTDIWVEDYVRNSKQHLDSRANVVFKLHSGEITVRLREGKLDISATLGGLVMEPSSSNVIYVSSRGF